MAHRPDYILDIPGLNQPQVVDRHEKNCGTLIGRPWLAVHWRCCSVYSRIYRNHQATAYHGRCPRCGRMVKARVGADGTSARFFEAM